MEYTYEESSAVANISDIDSQKIDLYAELIPSFSEQLEYHEKRNYGECIICIAFIGALLTIVGACLTAAAELVAVESAAAAASKTDMLNGAIAFILMLIPVVITIFLYNFAMNCRWSAILRGYLQFLERRINGIFKDVSMLYHGPLYASEIVHFPVNKYGPFALALGLFAVYVVCCYFSNNFSQCLTGSAANVYWIYFGAILAICTLFSALFIVALTRNDKAVQRLGFLCEKFYQDNCPDEDDERAMERFEQKREAHKELYFHLGGGRSIEILKKMMRETCKHFRRW